MRGGAKRKAGGAVRRDEGEGEEEEDIGGCGGRGREGRRRMRECAAQRRRQKGLVVDQE